MQKMLLIEKINPPQQNWLIIVLLYNFIFQLTVQEENVATPKHGAMVIRGEVAPGSNLKSALLDGETKHFDMERGFTRHPIDDKEDSCIVVKLGNPCIINHLRLLLWDKGKVVYGPSDLYYFDQYY